MIALRVPSYALRNEIGISSSFNSYLENRNSQLLILSLIHHSTFPLFQNRGKNLSLKLIQGSGYFFHDKMIAPVLLMGKGLLPPKKAKHGVGSCSSVSCKQPAVKCKAVAAVRLGRQQTGILSSKKLPRPLN